MALATVSTYRLNITAYVRYGPRRKARLKTVFVTAQNAVYLTLCVVMAEDTACVLHKIFHRPICARRKACYSETRRNVRFTQHVFYICKTQSV